MKKVLLLAVSAFLVGLMVILAACGSGGNSNATSKTEGDNSTKAAGGSADNTSTEPVTLKVHPLVALTDEDFQSLMVDPLKKKYPYITLELVRPGKGTQIADLVSAGTVPDIIMPPNAWLTRLQDMDLLFDITPLIKQQNIDLNRFDPVVLQALKSPKGELWGLPFARNFNALYYNKDIFDKFGVKYPVDGLMWDDAISLATKLTRSEGGVDYKGLDPQILDVMSFPFGITYVDVNKNKASIDTKEWRTVLQTAQKLYSIPGNEVKEGKGAPQAASAFLKDQNIAMVATVNIVTQFEQPASGQLNWDMVQYPQYKEQPGYSGKVDAHLLLISKTSAHKDAAMKVLETVTSDEVQLFMTRKTARVSPLKKADLQQQFAAEIPVMKGKHIEAIFKGKITTAPVYSPYVGSAQKIVNDEFYGNVLPGKKDINTMIRDATAQINQLLESK
jgi:multiple sugar transport system substrate-binding protein